VDLQRLNTADDLYMLLEKETGIPHERFTLKMDGRKLPDGMLANDIPGNATTTAMIPASREFPPYVELAYKLQAKNQFFFTSSCYKLTRSLTC
jgi:hypothetical protein